MGREIAPIVCKITDDERGLKEFESKVHASGKENDIMLQFPTVYIHNWKDKEDFEVYIGESNNIIQRTKQHYSNQADPDKWQYQLTTHNSTLYIIGHEHFNKSLTLDIENRLMLYMMSVDHVRKIHNLRGNPQNKYYPANELDSIFRKVWKKLRKYNKELFPVESEIKDSAVFKASPLHKLTQEQENIKEIIIQKIFDSLYTGKKNQLIFVEGEAGTGKTVLNSSTFYEIFIRAEEKAEKGDNSIHCCMMVNHDEQITIYSQIVQKLGLTEKYNAVVCKPTTFINKHTKTDRVNVAFIDEAHLLLTQGKQSYRGENQLQDIIDRADVTVAMFDENQVLTTDQYWESDILEKFKEQARKSNNLFELTNQLRMRAPEDIIDWIDNFTKNQQINQIPNNQGKYELRIFKNPEALELAIKDKAADDNHKLSRLIATYDWAYNNKDTKKRISKYWEVSIGKWHKPWNRELKKAPELKKDKALKSLSWAEQPQTIDEVGSTFTIQGFDLNYAGVILGPSVKYRNGKVVFDPSEKNYKRMTQNRTLSNGKKMKFGETLTKHEVRVLMTRGVEGLYIYACDKELRDALITAYRREKI